MDIGTILKCFKWGGTSMNEIEIIRNRFDFLLQHGLSCLYKKSNIEYYIAYSNAYFTIALSYDLRLHKLDVGILDNRGSKNYLSYMPLVDCKIGDPKSRDELGKKVEEIYFAARKDWTISKEHLCTIADLYRDFIEQNLNEIISIFQ